MVKKLVLLLPLLTVVPLFLAGALRPPIAEPASSFVPQPVKLGADLADAATDPAALLDRAAQRLAPEQTVGLISQLARRSELPYKASNRHKRLE